MGDPVVLVDRPSPRVARLLINRPDKRNAIDHAVRAEMIEALTALAGDRTVRALVFGGRDGVFSAGGDIPSMVGLDEDGARARMRHIHSLCRLIADSPVPVVSAIEGIGAGGAVGLALLGDRIVVGPGTKILFPFLRLGLTPDWGQLLTLPRRVGLPAARRLLSSGDIVGGDEAFRLALADRLVPDAEVMEAAIAEAERMALLPLDAFRRMKGRLNEPSSSLEAEFRREEDDQAVCLLSDDFDEGYRAFVGKRTPDFTTQ
ncbi:enoyl-CoA hydratase/isomerase family protein [Azospirillum sp. INR13]|uniref:enoyl-CoA hydratase/isomerase family protein n=1 Tax=Azospirillum sp. INR13 TaxID=2596919 RepID=UPI00189287A7|nr:enoyl-CoA hydratase/isomerase family protein [Azospirillum sp. INR13]